MPSTINVGVFLGGGEYPPSLLYFLKKSDFFYNLESPLSFQNFLFWISVSSSEDLDIHMGLRFFSKDFTGLP